jgi:UDP-GlcNAc:undecaprenyl-phosphate GlcNAc-1-phosphate transferase
MYAMLGLGLTAFLLCLISTPLWRDLFLRHNIVDLPDNDRKLHGKPIPRIGGIPIALSYAGALLIMLVFAPHGARIFVQHEKLLWALFPAAVLVFITGLVDDIIGLKPWQKLGGQVVAAVVAVALGARITLIEGVPASPWLTIPLSLAWLIGCTNAFNLIDGLDGLASGVGLFATVTTLMAAILQGNVGLVMATIPLAGCLLAFLKYNFSPASIFLGDSGSLTIGFMLGCFGLIWSQKSATMLGMAAPLMALALPLIDVGLSIGRRFLRSKPIFKGDRGHIHHMVLALGFKPRDTALILYAVCGIAALFSLLQSVSSFQFRGLTIVVFCLLSCIGISCLGYVEFKAARKALSKTTVMRVLQEEIHLQELSKALECADTVEECWRVIYAACRTLEFASAHLYLHGQSFEEAFDQGNGDSSWQMTISLGRKGHLSVTRVLDSHSPAVMMPTLHLIQESIKDKEIRLGPEYVTVSGARVISGAA